MYLFRLIYLYLEENYFSASLNGNYDNLNFVKTATTLLMVVGGLCLGIVLEAEIFKFYDGLVHGRASFRRLAKGVLQKETQHAR